MPGIVGIVDSTQQTPIAALLDKMSAVIDHENNGIKEVFANTTVAIGRVHLGILKSEPQPIFNEDKSVCAFMYGEIYDFESQKKILKQKGYQVRTDDNVEYIIHLYKEHGERFIEYLKGIFVIVIWDSAAQKLIIVNDRFGLKPLYYTFFQNKLIFSSEVKAIIQDEQFKKALNTSAMADFFSFGYMFGDKTFFKNINLLPTGSILTWQKQTLDIKKYWDLAYCEEYKNKDKREYTEEMYLLLKQAVNRQMAGEYRIGIPLSGGLDSRAIIANIKKEHYPLDTYTFGRGQCADLKYAREIANILGAVHRHYPLEPEKIVMQFEQTVRLTEGMFSVFDNHELSLFKGIKEHCDVLLDGLSGAILLGSFMNDNLSSMGINDDLDLFYTSFGNLFIKQNALFRKPNWGAIEGQARESFSGELQKARQHNNMTYNIIEYIDQKNEQRRMLLNGPVSYSSMFEMRLPLCDYDLTDFMLKLPPNLRKGKYLLIETIKNKYPELAAVPWQKTGLPLNSSNFSKWAYAKYSYFRHKSERIIEIASKGKIVPRRISDYADYSTWIRTTFRQKIENILLAPQTLERGYFNPEYLKSMIERHMNGRSNYFYLIGLLLSFELWHREFFD